MPGRSVHEGGALQPVRASAGREASTGILTHSYAWCVGTSSACGTWI